MLGLDALGRLLFQGHACFYPSDAGFGLVSGQVSLAIFIKYKSALLQTHRLVDEVGLGQVIQELMQDEQVAGMLTVGIYYSPTGGKAWIEDVVVDEAFRGQGLSKLLVAHAIQFVESKQIPLLMLTSNPTRVAANKLYQAMGFGRKETNVYRMTF